MLVLRIAFDSRDALAAEPRGWSRYARDLLAALRTMNGLEVLAMSGGGPEFVWEQVGLPLRLRKRPRPDVVHAPSCFLPLWRPVPGVVTIHDLAFEVFPEDFTPKTRAKFKVITPRAARSAERVVTVSQFTKDDVCERYGVDPGKVRVVPNAPSLPIGSGDGDAVAPAGPYLLGVGDLREKKNWGRLVTAWRALRAEGLPHRLVIAGGDAGEGAALREAAGPDPLELPGYVDDARLDALMRGADVLVHPSLYEGFGLVVAEAMARGIPVAAARGTALPEAGGDAALYFDPLDPDAIAAAVSDAIRRRDELSKRGLARAAELSWERSAALTVEAYREAVAAR